MTSNLIRGAAALATCLAASHASAETWNWLTFKSNASEEAQVVSTLWFADELEKRTNGDYKIRFHWSGSLASTREIPQALQQGVGEIGDVITSYFPDQFPLNNTVSFFLPQPHDALATGELLEKWEAEYPEYDEEFAKYNLKAIAVRPLEPYGLLCSKPVEAVDDLQGMRIRSYGFALPAMIEALGAVPVSMATAEAYEGLERNILDCTPTGPVLASGWKWPEVAKYYLEVPIGVTWGQHIVMNRETFEALPKDVQKTVTELGKEYLENYTDTLMQQYSETLDAWKADSSMHVSSLPGEEFLAKIKGDAEVEKIRQSWIDKADGLGVPGQKIADELMTPSAQ